MCKKKKKRFRFEFQEGALNHNLAFIYCGGLVTLLIELILSFALGSVLTLAPPTPPSVYRPELAFCRLPLLLTYFDLLLLLCQEDLWRLGLADQRGSHGTCSDQREYSLSLGVPRWFMVYQQEENNDLISLNPFESKNCLDGNVRKANVLLLRSQLVAY